MGPRQILSTLSYCGFDKQVQPPLQTSCFFDVLTWDGRRHLCSPTCMPPRSAGELAPVGLPLTCRGSGRIKASPSVLEQAVPRRKPSVPRKVLATCSSRRDGQPRARLCSRWFSFSPVHFLVLPPGIISHIGHLHASFDLRA